MLLGRWRKSERVLQPSLHFKKKSLDWKKNKLWVRYKDWDSCSVSDSCWSDGAVFPFVFLLETEIGIFETNYSSARACALKSPIIFPLGPPESLHSAAIRILCNDLFPWHHLQVSCVPILSTASILGETPLPITVTRVAWAHSHEAKPLGVVESLVVPPPLSADHSLYYGAITQCLEESHSTPWHSKHVPWTSRREMSQRACYKGRRAVPLQTHWSRSWNLTRFPSDSCARSS